VADVTYRDKRGKKLPRVTTIIGQMNKPALLYSAVKLMKDGKDHEVEWGIKRDAGTWCHHLIGLHLGREDEAPEVVHEESLALGAAAFDNWKRWWQRFNAEHDVTLVAVEEPIACDLMGVGGTPDLIARVNGCLRVFDWKTASKPAIYPEAVLQVAAYMEMYTTNNHGRLGLEGIAAEGQVVCIPTLAFADVVTTEVFQTNDTAPAINAFEKLLLLHQHMVGVRKLAKVKKEVEE
jgi:hypothetical protein